MRTVGALRRRRSVFAASRRRAGFTLVELLVAMFVLALAVAGAVGVIAAAGRSAAGAREKLVAEELARTALADAADTAQALRAANSGKLFFVTYNSGSDVLGPIGFEKRDPRTAPGTGWLWRAHSFDPAIGAYSLDVWVFQNPAEASVKWGQAADSDLKRRQTLFYLRTRLESRKP